MLDMVVDIEQWFTAGPFKEKIANHRTRIKNIMRQMYVQTGKQLPPSEETLIDEYFSDPNYKNRKQREEEKKIEELKKLGR